MPTDAICDVCNGCKAPYKCPRCGVFYCCLGCYKTHGPRCTNAFYERQVLECMKGDQVTDETRQRTLEMLQRDREDRVCGEEQEALEDRLESERLALEEALAHLEAGEGHAPASSAEAADIFMALPPALRERFRCAVSGGEILDDIAQLNTEPWYMKDPRRVVVVVDDDVAPLYPPLPSKPPRLQELAQTVSPTLHCNIIETLYAYSFAMRVFCCDWLTDAEGFLDLVLDLSHTLQPRLKKSDVSEIPPYLSLDDVFQWLLDGRPHRRLYDNGPQFAAAVLRDLSHILAGPTRPVRALEDLRRAVALQQRLLSDAGRPSIKSNAPTKALLLVERKLVFYISWAFEQPPVSWDEWASIAREASDGRTAAILSSPGGPIGLISSPSPRRPVNLNTAARPLVQPTDAASIIT